MEILRSQVKIIAEKYANLIDKRLTTALNEPEIDCTAMAEINDGIRMLNHVASTLERIERLNRGNETNVQSNI